MACQRWVGRGSGRAADAAATDAMRSALATAPGTGTVVIGEGVKDRAPMLYDGELVGTRRGPSFDIAVDPLECTTLCAKGLPGSLATIAFAEAGSMARLGTYLDKLVGPPTSARRSTSPMRQGQPRAGRASAREAHRGGPCGGPRQAATRSADRGDPPGRGLRGLAARRRRGGCVGAVAPGRSGGSLDGDRRYARRRDGGLRGSRSRRLHGGAARAPAADEKRALLCAGLSTERVYSVEYLVRGDALFAATGVTGGELLRRPWRSGEARSRTP